jgi:dTDP-4-dehydrorhamnose 3,5-epimerase
MYRTSFIEAIVSMSNNTVNSAKEVGSLSFSPSKKILDGMLFFDLKPIVDGRGDLTELWSAPWMKTAGVVQPKHIYQSATDHGVIKAWHLHRTHTDQFAITRGKIQVVCADVRKRSKTFGQVNSFIVGAQQPAFIKIPPGIMHGWKALSIPEALVLNLQSHTYDPKDELRFPWDIALQDIWEPIFR